jgi:2-alkyl-3-oxoalkanoate reductase
MNSSGPMPSPVSAVRKFPPLARRNLTLPPPQKFNQKSKRRRANMRVLIAGAGGAVGQRLVPLMAQAGHTVAALTRSESKRESLSRMGAMVFIADALDPKSVDQAIATFRPNAIVNQLTSIPPNIDLRHFDRDFALTNRLRTEGTDNLIAAGRRSGATRFLSQSFAGWGYARVGGPVKTEEDPLDPLPPVQFRTSLNAIKHMESAVLSKFPGDGVVLRYGAFYGPGTSISKDGSVVQAARKRMLPIVAAGTAVWSFIHIDDVASATLAALDAKPGIYNVTDDDPALVRDWVPYLAEVVGAKPPLHLPAWLVRPLIGAHGLVFMQDARGASNQKARREMAWTPKYSSWREGFQKELGSRLESF